MQATDPETMPATPLRHFGSSGIRGPLARVDTELALRLGRALAAQHARVVVGHDARRTGARLEDALVAGLLAGGADVARAGLVPTPALAHAARHHDLGVQVTASHNPAPDNGFKLWTPAGASPEATLLRQVEAHMEDPPAAAEWRQVGRLETRHRVLGDYHDAVLRHVRAEVGTTRPLAGHRIALDCAHGAAAVSTPLLLSALGAELTLVGGAPDGRFPDHPSEPDASHLARFARIVADADVTLGIAHDGDADRTVFLHPDGRLVPGERLLAVLAESRNDTRIALPVDASGVVADHLPEATITITPVGDIHLSRALQRDTATIGCEPSGTWFFADWAPTPEGPYAAAAVAARAATDDTLFERIDALPRYERSAVKHPLPAGARRDDAHALVATVGRRLADAVAHRTVSDVDGVRIDTEDGWVLVRPSGTEPLVRITAEARSRARSDELVHTAGRLLEEALDQGGAA